jgi:hypothetical protein
MPNLNDKERELAAQIMAAFINHSTDPDALFAAKPTEDRSFESVWKRIANSVRSQD